MVPDRENYRKVNCLLNNTRVIVLCLWEFVVADLFNFEIREQVITDKDG